ncbi:MAG: hypothetical protein RMJ98_02665 [Myxococcales bacterium]|nr:hypothetical protein [Myxococcales bacterium]
MHLTPRIHSLLFLAVVGGACGHPATQQECEEILDKVVELELMEQYVNDPSTREQRKKITREVKGKDLLPRCIGRKITTQAMVCIRQAQSYDEINNYCLR